MRLREPDWWYSDDGVRDWRSRLLEPLGGVYGWMTERRFRYTTPYASQLPVICVGNFTAGGTGKTPLAVHVAETLIAVGESPAFLSRGYGGSQSGPAWVNTERDTARDVGDEPLLLARAAPVMVARNRRDGARAIENAATPVTAIVMDDGLQNPSLEKDLSIALVDGNRGVGNGGVMPCGPLRARLDFQLSLVDAIVVNLPSWRDGSSRNSTILDALRRDFPGPVIEGALQPQGDPAWLHGARVLAFAGIGNPNQFFAMLESRGAQVVRREVFSDHHLYTDADAGALLSAARKEGLALVTTTKDWVRLNGSEGARVTLLAEARPVPVEFVFPERDEDRLKSLIKAVLKSGGSTPAAH